MGRKVSDGAAIDFTAPAATLIEKGELYRVDNWTHVAMDQIDATEVDRGYSGEVRPVGLWRVKVPAATAATRGDYLGWSAGAGFKAGGTDMVAIVAPVNGGWPALAVAKVEGVRNSRGYATVLLLGATT
jgi:hypothetical protein